MRRHTAFITICLLTLAVGCATAVRIPDDVAASTDLVWPAPPADPRLAYVMEFSSAEELGIRKGFLQQLREFVGGPRQERMIRPMSVVESRGNRIFVADPGVRGVHLFDLDRGSYQLIQRSDGAPLPSPVGLAAGLAGEIYVSDSRLASLFVIEPGASTAIPVPLEALLSQPTGIALDPTSGRIYLVDTGSHEIKIFARDGALLRRIGGRGTGPGQFNYPTMIWMSTMGELVVSDSLNFRTQVFDAEGNYLRQFGVPGNRPGYQAQSKGIATDSRGQVYVVDSALHAVQIFDRFGRFLYRLGFRGEGAGEFWLPSDVFVGTRDMIFVADAYNGRVQVFRYTGGARL
mgnify:CR=1 FL=1